MRSSVYIQLPKAGLGNMMLVWARGATFAKLNNLPYATSPWRGIRLGAYIRGERMKRLYWKNFKETPFSYRLKNIFSSRQTVLDPSIEICATIQPKTKYVVTKMSSTDDLFGDIRPYRNFIIEELSERVHPRIHKIINEQSKPVISVHIRRGDFKKANYITSLTFFKEAINNIRTVCGSNLPVTVFSDAETGELEEILQMPYVERAKTNPDIVDILLMSKSKFIVLSRSSSFSYWAAFLSTAFVVMHKDDWQKKIGTQTDNPGYREIRWENADADATKELMNELAVWNASGNLKNL